MFTHSWVSGSKRSSPAGSGTSQYWRTAAAGVRSLGLALRRVAGSDERIKVAVRTHVDAAARLQHRLELAGSPPPQPVAAHVRRDELAARRPQLVPVQHILGLCFGVDSYRF